MTSLTLVELKERVQPSLVQDFDGLWEAWVAESGSEDLGHFVSHLLEWRLIPAELGEALLPNLELEEDPTDVAPPLSGEPSEDLSYHLVELDASAREPRAGLANEALPPSTSPAGAAPDRRDPPVPEAINGAPRDDDEILDPTIVVPSLGDLGLTAEELEKAAPIPPTFAPTYEDEEEAATALMVRPTPDSATRAGRSDPAGIPATTQVARDPDLGRRLVVKTLADSASSAERLRFVREALVAAQLDHPGVPTVLEIRSPHIYVFRYVEGPTLQQALDEVRTSVAAGHGVPVERSLSHLLDRFVHVCETIAYSSSRGLVHGNLHPGAVILGPFGATYVVDWGLARVFSREVPDPVDLANNGSSDNNPEDARADIHALGWMLYEILTLRTPAGAAAADWTHRYGLPIDPGLRAVAAAALSPHPSEPATHADRASGFASAGALAGAVRRARATPAPAEATSEAAESSSRAAGSRSSSGSWPASTPVAIGLGLGWLVTLAAWMGSRLLG